MKTRAHAILLALACAAALPQSASAQSATPNEWTWRFGLNLWLPGIDTTTSHSLPAGGGGITAETDPSNYLEKLKFTFMGSLDAQRGPWSLGADVVYLDFGDLETKVRTITGPGGAISIPIDTGSHSDLKGFVGTFVGGYALMQAPAARTEMVAGLRYTKLKPRLEWEFSGPTGTLDRSGTIESSKSFLDGVVGVRGKAALGSNWELRYYADIGGGDSQLTYQLLGGIGYKFSWGDATLSYRHLAYELKDDRPISDAKFSGPQFTFGFTF